MLDFTYAQGLLQELRMVSYVPGKGDLTDQKLAAALTVNENLKTLGYTLKPADLVRLALSPSLEGLYDRILSLMGSVKAAPMYPGFPGEVMEISEARFRFHQMIHYFSTYGIEFLTGLPVEKGWLPCEGEAAPTEEDKALLEAAVLEMVPEEEACFRPLSILMGRRQRLIDKEKSLVLHAAQKITPEQAGSLQVPFKENLEDIFVLVLEGCDRETAGIILRNICQHTGDVWRGIRRALDRTNWHLTTAKKRALVRLLESYPAADFSENLIYSGRRSEEILLLLKHLDYARFSRSKAHMEAVSALRNGGLRSWFSRLEVLLQEKDPGALDMLGARPGLLVRYLRRLLLLGYDPDRIREILCASAKSLSVQTLLTTIGKVHAKSLEKIPAPEELEEEISQILEALEKARAEERAVTGGLENWEAVDAFMDPYMEEDRAFLLKQREHCLQELDSTRELMKKAALRTTVDRTKLSMETLRRMERYYLDTLEEIGRTLASEDALRAYSAEQLRRQIESAAEDRQYAEMDLAEALDRKKKADADRRRARCNGPLLTILEEALKSRLSGAGQVFRGKKVFLAMDELDLDHSEVRTGDRSQEGGYIRSGLAYRIPDSIGAVRLFVYWNDSNRVDIDLHASARDTYGRQIEIGWNTGFRENGIVFSGDITHSDAAEFIDVSMRSDIAEVALNIHLYDGRPNFAAIEECFVGMMAVSKYGKPLKHYDPRNCFFTHFLKTPVRNLQYGKLHVQERYLRFEGDTADSGSWYTMGREAAHPVSLRTYLEILFAGKDVTLVESREEADLVLVAGHPAAPEEISLLDHNFFMEE